MQLSELIQTFYYGLQNASQSNSLLLLSYLTYFYSIIHTPGLDTLNICSSSGVPEVSTSLYLFLSVPSVRHFLLLHVLVPEFDCQSTLSPFSSYSLLSNSLRLTFACLSRQNLESLLLERHPRSILLPVNQICHLFYKILKILLVMRHNIKTIRQMKGKTLDYLQLQMRKGTT